jgi:hypothetical protein
MTMNEAEVTMKEEEDNTRVILSYLRRIAAAASALAKDDTDMDIARRLPILHGSDCT